MSAVAAEGLERLADLVAERILERLERGDPASWLTPVELAHMLGVERSFVYEHADELGVRRLGTGPKAPLRFRLDDVLERTSDECHAAEPSRRRKTTRRFAAVDLLPVKGR